MGDATSISWTDATWNPIRGCRRTAPAGSKQSGCGDPTGGGCYAERQAARFCGPGQAYEGLITLTANGPRWSGKVRFVGEHLADPLRWRKPRRIFVDSMSDLFYEGFTNEQIAAVFGVMAAAPRHTFQVLTKRAQRMREWVEWAWKRAGEDHAADNVQEGMGFLLAFEAAHRLGDGSDGDRDRWYDRLLDEMPRRHSALPWPLPNVWLGVSVENQAAAEERIPELLATPSAVRFLSCEPLIGEVDLDVPRCDYPNHEEAWGVADDGATPWCSECDSERSYGHWLGDADEGIKWVIAGCESGPGARPSEIEWLRSLRRQCDDHSVSFFLKQAVATPGDLADGCVATWVVGADEGSRSKRGGVIEQPYLDGVQHAAFPEVTRG